MAWRRTGDKPSLESTYNTTNQIILLGLLSTVMCTIAYKIMTYLAILGQDCWVTASSCQVLGSLATCTT